MRILKGPLGDHLNYIKHIAIGNCLDYFAVVNSHKGQCKNNMPDKYMRLRYFLNAMESLNNIPEYLFHDLKTSKNWEGNILSDFLGKIRSNNNILRDIEAVANAYKHCTRWDKSELHARDMQSMSMVVKLDGSGLRINLEFESIEDVKIMEEGYRFWLDYSNKSAAERKSLLNAMCGN
jgi:hypothetical protein